MCLAYPMTLMEIDGAHGTVEARGLRLRVGLALVPEAKVGDALLVHAGYAIAIVDEAESEAPRRLFAELATFERSRNQGDEAPALHDGNASRGSSTHGTGRDD